MVNLYSFLMHLCYIYFPLFLSLCVFATLDTDWYMYPLLVQYRAVIVQGWGGRAYEPLHHLSLRLSCKHFLPHLRPVPRGFIKGLDWSK